MDDETKMVPPVELRHSRASQSFACLDLGFRAVPLREAGDIGCLGLGVKVC